MSVTWGRMSMKEATITGTVLAALCFGTGLVLAVKSQPVYHLTPQHNRYEIGISCTAGADPTVEGNFDGMLLVSCGNEAK